MTGMALLLCYSWAVLCFLSPTVCRSAIDLSGTEFVYQGEAIRLICNATGVPNPLEDVDWFFNGHIIRSSVQEEIIITKFLSPETKSMLSTLEIERSKKKHSGIYVCRGTDFAVKSHHVQVIDSVPQVNSTNLVNLLPDIVVTTDRQEVNSYTGPQTTKSTRIFRPSAEKPKINSDDFKRMQYNVLKQQKKKLKVEIMHFRLMNKKLRKELFLPNKD
uniref:Uncharacterized protein LOC111112905 n=1 Tax=Crassostrea virginica TaxID=6565 RepID=A0A8B8BUF2_CRAVI|nr:uncharacterized protein LOC111112905 [Crassostrea virginica]